MVVAQIVVSLLHIGFIGIIGWPVFLAAGLTILIWRNASEPERVWINDDVAPMLSVGTERQGRAKLMLRAGAGVLLGAGGHRRPDHRAIRPPPRCARSAGPC